ncbi:MAG: TolC family protein [FCB group bacterium]|jgi:outer membrane protein TolC
MMKFDFKKELPGILFLFFIYFTARSQQTLTLEQSIQFAKENSPSAKNAIQSYKTRKFNYKSFTADYLPQLSLSGSIPGLDRAINPITQPSGTISYLPQSNLNTSGNLTISQKIPFSGATFYVSSGISRTDIFGTYNTFYWLASPVQISLSQPIFQFNPMQWDRDIQALQDLSYDRQFVEEMEDVSADVVQKFFDLYLAQMNVANAEFNVSINDTLYQLSKGRFNLGKIAENDLLQTELGLLNVKNDLESARLDYQNARENFKIALGYDITNEINIKPNLDFLIINVDPDFAYEQAMKNRSDILNYQISELQADRSLNQAERNNSFNALLSASYGLNQSAGNLPEAYKNLLDQERFNLSFSIPLFQWGKGTAQIESALSEKDRIKVSIENQKKLFLQDVKYQTQKFLLLQKQVALSAKADTIATRRFEVAKNRYLIGKIDLNTFFIAQNEKNTALNTFISTLRNYWAALYRLRRITLYDFIKKEPLIKQ